MELNRIQAALIWLIGGERYENIQELYKKLLMWKTSERKNIRLTKTDVEIAMRHLKRSRLVFDTSEECTRLQSTMNNGEGHYILSEEGRQEYERMKVRHSNALKENQE